MSNGTDATTSQVHHHWQQGDQKHEHGLSGIVRSGELRDQAVNLLSGDGKGKSGKHSQKETARVADGSEHVDGASGTHNPLHHQAVDLLSNRRGSKSDVQVALVTAGGGGPGDQQSASASDAQQHIDVPPIYGKADGLDAKKSVADLMHDGTFTDATKDASEKSYQKLKPGESPKISVTYENKDKNAHQPAPNYVVGKDGSVKVVHNPEGNPPDANVVVQVQRDLGQTDGPTDKQQAAVDKLVGYEGARIQQQYGDKLPEVQTTQGPVKQVDVNDPSALVSDSVVQQLGDRIPESQQTQPEHIPPPVPVDVQHTSDRMNRVPGSGGGISIPRESAPGRQEGDNSQAGIDQMIPPREVPAAPSEPKSIVSMKDVLAALAHPDRSEPYGDVQESPNGYRVGRYGMNQGFTLMGLAELLGIDLGNPPDLSKLADYLNQHPDALQKAVHKYADKLRKDADSKHLPADDKLRQTADNLDKFATKLGDPQFAAGFNKFLGDMNHKGDPITKDRVNQFLPKELQEAIAQGGIDQLARQMNINPNKINSGDAGRIAAGAYLGHVPTAQETSDPDYQRFTNAAGNVYDLANARQDGLGDINVTDAGGKILVHADHNVGQQLWRKYMSDGNLGCAASVANVLNQAGFSYANSMSVRGLEDQLLSHGWHYDSTPHAGDVVTGYRGGSTSGSAHCGIVGQNGTSYDNHSSNGEWLPDSLSRWNTSSFHAGVHFLRPPGS
ncbi:MAG TPA: hypothetical protein V6C81_02570 [Planktothrix sp.]|jgi:hypothetical protein